MHLTIAAVVHTEPINLANFALCSRFLDAAAKSTIVSGTVVEVLRGTKKAGRNRTDLRVTWLWLGQEVEKVMELRSVWARARPAVAHPANYLRVHGG